MFPMDIHTCTSSITGFYDRCVCDCMCVCGLHTISHGRLTVAGLFIFLIFTINFDLVSFWYKHSYRGEASHCGFLCVYQLINGAKHFSYIGWPVSCLLLTNIYLSIFYLSLTVFYLLIDCFLEFLINP